MWPKDRAISSDDGVWDGTSLLSPSPTEFLWKGHTFIGRSPTGMLSPVSSGIDTVMDNSSVPTTAHSTASSCADSWINGYNHLEDGGNETTWNHWERGRSESITVPKSEPTDDDVKLNDVTAAPVRLNMVQDISRKQKRPRGRPRKNSSATAVSTTKITKGRSKTGCITCRKRKKKCDEAKPRCKYFRAFYFRC